MRCASHVPAEALVLSVYVGAAQQLPAVGRKVAVCVQAFRQQCSRPFRGQIPNTEIFFARGREPSTVGGKGGPAQAPSQVLCELTMCNRSLQGVKLYSRGGQDGALAAIRTKS